MNDDGLNGCVRGHDTGELVAVLSFDRRAFPCYVFSSTFYRAGSYRMLY
jgi:hypothetical protein